MPRPADKYFDFELIIGEIVQFFVKIYEKRQFLHREGSEAEDAGVNDSPVDCQSRVLTEPQREMPLPYKAAQRNRPINR